MVSTSQSSRKRPANPGQLTPSHALLSSQIFRFNQGHSIFQFLLQFPYYRNSDKYSVKCTNCQETFPLVRWRTFGVSICSNCEKDNIIEAAPANYVYIRYDSCKHVSLVERNTETGKCETCQRQGFDSDSGFSEESAVQRPQMRSDMEEAKKRKIIQEVRRKPYLIFPEYFESRCVWEGCQKMFTPFNCENGTARCSHCSREVPIDFGKTGHVWVFYNRCSHIHSVPANFPPPRSCPTCGLESAARPSGIAAPKRKSSSALDLPTMCS